VTDRRIECRIWTEKNAKNIAEWQKQQNANEFNRMTKKQAREEDKRETMAMNEARAEKQQAGMTG